MWPFRRFNRKSVAYVPPPETAEAGKARAVLSGVPGPSPWYLVGNVEAARPHAAGHPLHWGSAGELPPHTGKTLLQDVNGVTVAVCDFQCYVQALADGGLLVWAVEEEGMGASFRRRVRLQVFDTTRLEPIESLSVAYGQLGPGRRFYAAAGQRADVTIPTSLDDGVHSVDLPEAFRGHAELLLPVDSTAEGRRSNHADRMHLRMWILDPDTGRLEIIPQDWYNEGAYDFGYQWVTRMARASPGAPVYGEGIRLGIFRLDESLRGVASWPVENVQHGPTPEGGGY